MNPHFRKILLKGVLFLLPLVAYYIGFNIWRLSDYRRFSNDASPIYHAIFKSKQKINKRKVVFGDSVGGQLYPNDADSAKDYHILTTTAPSSLVGIYVLLQNVIENNDVKGMNFYYIVHPSSLNEGLNSKATYTHFVKPFYTMRNRKYFSAQVKDTIRTIPYWYIAQLPFVKISNWHPDFEREKKYKRTISPIYLEYLAMIDALARQHQFRFTAFMPLLRENSRNADYSEIKQLIAENGLEKIFDGYFDNIRYLPIEQFYPNSNHYLEPWNLGDNPLGF